MLGLILGMDYAAYWHLPMLFNPDNYDGETEDIFPGTVSVNIVCCPVEATLVPRVSPRRVHARDVACLT